MKARSFSLAALLVLFIVFQASANSDVMPVHAETLRRPLEIPFSSSILRPFDLRSAGQSGIVDQDSISKRGDLLNEPAYEDLRTLLNGIWQDHQRIQVRVLRKPVESPADLSGDVTEFMESIEASYTKFFEIFAVLGSKKIPIDRAMLEALNDPRNPDLADNLYDGVVDQRIDEGATITPALVLPHPSQLWGYLQSGGEDLDSVLSTFPERPNGVRWNGDLGLFEWSDRELRRQSYVIGTEVVISPKEFRKKLLALPSDIQSKFRRNSEGSRADDRVEPFDLIKGAVLEGLPSLIKGRIESRLIASKPLHRALHTLFDMTAESDPIGATLPDLWAHRDESDNRDRLSITCSRSWESPYDAGENALFFYRNPLVGETVFSVSAMVTEGKPSESVSCGDKVFDVQLNALKADPLSLPPKYNLNDIASDRPAEVLVTFSLTTEITPQVLKILQTYLNLHGFRSRGRESVVNTKNTFLTAIEHADIVIPVAHLLDVNSFHVGTETSRQLIFEKDYSSDNGLKQPVRVRVLFPNLRPDEQTVVQLTRQELAEAMRLRRAFRRDSLVIVHTSCYGATNLRSWTLAFRRALEKERDLGNIDELADALDVPLVYAFKGGFPTSTPFDLLTSMLYPLGAIESLAEGSSGEDLLKMLEEPAPKSLLYNFFGFVVGLIPGFPVPDKVLNYQPVWNLAKPELLRNDDYEFLVIDRSGAEPIRRY